MKTSLNWDGGQTYSNAKNALFGSEAEIIKTKCDLIAGANLQKTSA
jgi:hypothetical protein